MGVNIKSGNNSAGLANVSSTYELQVTTPQEQANAGFVQLSSEIDDGTVLGTRTNLALEASDDYRLRVGVDQTLFNMSFEGTTVPSGHFQQVTATATVTQLSNFMIVNGGSSTTSGQGAYIRTYRHFPSFGTYPTYVDMWIREVTPTAVNAISEWGLLYLTAVATQTPLDGVFFRRLSGGGLRAVINNNGTETEYTIDVTNVPSRDGIGVYDPTEVSHYLIAFHNDVVRFWINDILVATIDCPNNQAAFISGTNIPLGFRVLNINTVTPSARQLQIGFLNVGIGDQNTSKPWSHAMVGGGQGAYQTQVGSAVGPTVTRGAAPAGWVTSGTARAAGSWVATSGPATATLGGMFVTPAMSTLTSDADYPIFAYQVPTGTATLPGKTLYVTGIRVGEGYISTATPVPMQLTYIVTVGGTAVATSSADSTIQVAPRGIVVGSHGFPALPTGVTGSVSAGFEVNFNSPLVYPAGSYFTFVARPFGTVAANTLVVSSSLSVNGYFE
jgi:hypothetical protein